MSSDDSRSRLPMHTGCCPCGHAGGDSSAGTTRREFLALTGGLGLLGTALTGLSWAGVTDQGAQEPPPRRGLVVKPLFTYPKPQRVHMSSWRNWGGIETEADVRAEEARIRGELDQLQAQADFPIKFLPLATTRTTDELAAQMNDIQAADAVLFYSAGDGAGNLMADVNQIDGLGKHVIFFVRYKSGPVYYWYEGAMARLLHQHTDTRASKSIGYDDVVVDSLDEVRWRLRSLCGLHNTLGSRIIAVGGPGAWAQPEGVVPDLVREKWKLDIQTVSYDDLGKMIAAAKADKAAVERARQQAEEYVRLPGTTIETERAFIDNAFLLEQVFRQLLTQADCRAMTINGCMGTIMPMAETSACLTLSLLNDAGYQAYCESDFVVIPAGMLLANTTGRPVFLNDPTYPHDHLITLAHCTAPRRMGGQKLDAARIMTHFESDYGAAPKVEMPVGQTVTNIVPDFRAQRWTGLLATIDAAPMLPICRSQIDIRYACSDDVLARHMPGFHWMTGYGDSRREIGYSLGKVGIAWDDISHM
jgi:hypothetical protein